ncbi:MAG: type II toxin-antitoxin system PemK/MazF family toxin [Baekduiaceae bacterium]
MIRRGEVWWADLGVPIGSEPGLRRPVVVLSSDRYNASALSTVTVVSLTTTMRLAAMPGNLIVPAEISGLTSDAVVNVTQLASIDRMVFEERVATLPAWVIAQIDDGVRAALDL